MNNETLKKILDKHLQWLKKKKGGVCADLRGADLTDAYLTDANLRGADLTDANLRGADLTDANLRGANLRGSDLTNTELNWTNLEEVIGLDVIIVQINTSQQNRQIKYIPSLNKVFVGCFSGTLDELKEEVKETHKDNSKIKERYLKAINFIEEIVKDYEEERVDG